MKKLKKSYERTTGANTGSAKVAVPCFADTFVQGGSSLL